mmetsp:Transcript_565/g.887  ORF Transcript_565/g.887 Transcript_565/m.887 type:complete len:677 (-) Transcript_565:59-2089(-)
MDEREEQPMKSIRRSSFIEAFGIPEDEILDTSNTKRNSQHSITISDFDGSVCDDIDSNGDTESSFNSNAPNFAGGNVRRRGSRSRNRNLRAESRNTIGAFSNKTGLEAPDFYAPRRSSTGSLADSFGDMSLQSFTSESSFMGGSSIMEQKGLQIANLLFVTDAEMLQIIYDENDDHRELGNGDKMSDDTNLLSASLPPSSILGTGAFSTVRLAWRKIPSQLELATQDVGGDREDGIDSEEVEGRKRRQQRRSIVRVQSQDSDSSLPHKGQLVAVKMIEKSILKQKKTMQKDADNRLTVRTALDDIEKEIATMKRLCHPNCVQLFEVIDSVESDKLYMVLEYVSLGEILSNVDGTDRYERKRYRRKVKGLTPEGHFDEKNAALYFVDILHGLAYLHRHSICHRDLKPENILLGLDGIAKISDFGVAHMFDDERNSWSIMQQDPMNEFLSDDEEDVSEMNIGEAESPTHLSKRESEEAMNMSSRHSSGLLQKTEGTLYFYAPEMCSVEAKTFSGYAADLWAAGVCLHIFTTGKLPFFAMNPSDLFDMIVQNEIQYDSLDLSNDLKSLLRMLLTKDPQTRAGVGDCLKHNFCNDARVQRTRTLRKEFQQSTGEIVLTEKDIDFALSVTKETRRSLSGGLSKFRESFRRKRGLQPKRPSFLQDLFKNGYFRSSKKGRFFS